MAVDTFYAGAGDGIMTALGTSYAIARAGTGGFGSVDTAGVSGQGCGQAKFGATDWYIFQGFLPFDTSSIPDTDNVSAAYPSLYFSADNSSTDFIMEMAIFDFSAGGLTSADYRTGTQLAAMAPVASKSTVGVSLAAYTDFTELSSLLAAAINKTGFTYLAVFSQNDRLNVAPTGDEYMTYWMSEKGAGFQPKLTVTHAPAAAIDVPPGLKSVRTAAMATHRASRW